MYIALSIIAVAIMLVINEIWWRGKDNHKEHSRKIIHILVGSFIAFWPFYMSWNWIRIISLAFLIGTLISKLLNIFTSIHEVERFTVGEISFAIAVGAVTFITKIDWIYAAAILQMSLADGLAAIAGVHFGHKNKYKVFGATKSIVGSITFFVVSTATLFAAVYLARVRIPTLELIGIGLVAAIVENIAVYGLDDLFLPVVVAFILSQI